jgi:plastocyanin
MNNKLILVIAAIVGVLIVIGGGFYVMNMNKSTTNPTPVDIATPTSVPVTESAITPSEVTQTEITVEGGEFKFTPSKITVKKGEKVKLTFKNTGKFPHDFVIADLSLATKRIQPGEEDTVEFTPEKIGEFKIICGVGNHEEQGMTGTLTVE